VRVCVPPLLKKEGNGQSAILSGTLLKMVWGVADRS
jgi:hypothetical protein